MAKSTKRNDDVASTSTAAALKTTIKAGPSSKVDDDGKEEGKKNETQESASSLDSNVFVNERKEFKEVEFNIEAAATLYGILFGVVVLFLGPTIYLFVSYEIYNKELNYIWVAAYAVAQFLGFFVVDPLVILMIANYVADEKRRSTLEGLTHLASQFRESLIIWEDYQFALAFQKSKMQ